MKLRSLPMSLAAVALLSACVATAHAYDYNVLYSFHGNPDGAVPVSSPIKIGDVLYGTTDTGGIGLELGPGTLFGFNLTSRVLTPLHVFSAASDGTRPDPAPVLVGNTLYGITLGGSENSGPLYAYDLTSRSYALPPFVLPGRPADRPRSGLAASGSVLYGMSFDVLNSPHGAIFSYDTASGTAAVLHILTGSAADAGSGQSTLIKSGNLLYGMSTAGGSANKGTLFACDITSGTLSVLHSFTGGTAEGSLPTTAVTLLDHTLYGMTRTGGASDLGTLFAYDLQTQTYSTLHSFTGGPAEGAFPEGSLITDGVLFYGTTSSGAGAGTVFSFDPATRTMDVLHAFPPGVSPFVPPRDPTGDGKQPAGDLLLADNTLYGFTQYGGTDGYGTIFSITLPEPSTLLMVALGLGLGLSQSHRHRQVSYSLTRYQTGSTGKKYMTRSARTSE